MKTGTSKTDRIPKPVERLSGLSIHFFLFNAEGLFAAIGQGLNFGGE